MKFVRFSHNGKILEGYEVDGFVEPAGANSCCKIDIEDITLLPPCEPTKIVCTGLNYADHAAELGMSVPSDPVIFLKPPSSVIGPLDSIKIPASSKRVDFEAELGVVIKNITFNIKEEDAFDHIFGYLCLNDVTARDLQEKDGQWTRAKSFDTFCPIGPCIETDLDPRDIRISSYLNGELKQDSRTSDFIFPIARVVSFISGIMTLYPGDIVATGTPSGVGEMKEFDEIVVEIEGIGRLENHVVRGA